MEDTAGLEWLKTLKRSPRGKKSAVKMIVQEIFKIVAAWSMKDISIQLFVDRNRLSKLRVE